MADSIESHCYLMVSVAGSDPLPVVIELFTKDCPQTCKNFIALCDTEKECVTTKASPQPTYRGCQFHRVIPNFMAQGGDFERFDGTGGYSPIAAGGAFRDESFRRLHDKAGILSMANSGKNTNKSQFFITFQATPHLNGKHVVFGHVVQGMDVVQSMANVERVGDRPAPMQRIVITDCGVGKSPAVRTKNDQAAATTTVKVTASKSGSKKRKKEKRKSKKKTKKKSSKRKHSSSSESSSDSDSDTDSRGDSDSKHDDDRKKPKRRKHEKRKRSRSTTARRDPSDSSSSPSMSDSGDRDNSRSKEGDKKRRKRSSSRNRGNSSRRK